MERTIARIEGGAVTDLLSRESARLAADSWRDTDRSYAAKLRAGGNVPFPGAGLSDVDRPPVHPEGRFLERLREGGVGVHGARDVLARSAELHRDRRFGDQL